jgi:hypothetical protein
MLKLQIKVLDKWVNANETLMRSLPEDVDVLIHVRRQWPASDWRVAFVKEVK